jgi:hypothetical protein
MYFLKPAAMPIPPVLFWNFSGKGLPNSRHLDSFLAMQHIRRHTFFCIACLLGMLLAVATSLFASSNQFEQMFSHVASSVQVGQIDSPDREQGDLSKLGVVYDSDVDQSVIVPDMFAVVLLSRSADAPRPANCAGFSHCGALTPRPPSV